MKLFFILFSFIKINNAYDLESGSGLESIVSNDLESIVSNDLESDLRKHLFKNYSNEYRPVIDYKDNVKVNFTLNINSLESFDQISEKVKFNMEMNYVWYDEYLKWNKSLFDVEYINIGSEPIWKPDLELYNSASYPELWSLHGSTKIYHTGKVRWVLPILYSFSCPLKLDMFPFDTQNCQMDFGSWKMNKDFLDIRINPEFKNKQNSVNENSLVNYKDFNHNEWTITNIQYDTIDTEYLCCPGELWPITHINIFMTRKYHKYLIVMIMTAFLTISALVVNSLSAENYKRTYLLVFIPLSIIWLQLYIASKIPVIEYSTLMERFIMSSFITCILCALESSVVYCILNNYFKFLGGILKKNNLDKKNYDKKNIDFIKKGIDEENINSILFTEFRDKILVFDEYFKLFIVMGYFISIIVIVEK
jgi:nicotinic acetylcholine receptor, invertebrate